MVEQESKASQCQRILDYIDKFGYITASNAMDELGCFRLASRIHDLKRKGYEIESWWMTGTNRYGKEVRFKAYRLEEGSGAQ